MVFLHDEKEVRILGSDCSLRERWILDERADAFATSPEQDLLAIQLTNWLGTLELLAAGTHKVTQRWVRTAGLGQFVFADGGRLACGPNPRPGGQRPDVACWDTKTGAKVSENDRVSVAEFGELSAGARLLAMTDSKVISRDGKFWEFMDMDGSEEIPLRRLIWNVRSGQDVASWGGTGKLQQPEVWGTDHRRYPSKVKIDSVVSLSPTGKYVAEGGSGSVSVYALRP